jgi:hypothetical protein
METWRRKAGLFATLRRDRTLFALAGTLILLFHAFQPLADARASVRAMAWVICTTLGMAAGMPGGKELPPPNSSDDCPKCIAGAACGPMAAKPKMLAAVEPAFPTPSLGGHTGAASPQEPVLAGRLNEPPPAIRAPPLFA